MNAVLPQSFQHATKFTPPLQQEIVGVALLDESPAATGVYYRTKDGKLYPCRTVSREDPCQHTSICESWLCMDGIHEDKRSIR